MSSPSGKGQTTRHHLTNNPDYKIPQYDFTLKEDVQEPVSAREVTMCVGVGVCVSVSVCVGFNKKNLKVLGHNAHTLTHTHITHSLFRPPKDNIMERAQDMCYW